MVIVTSDHGWENAKVGHNAAPDGFFAMAGGPALTKGERGRIHIYDIAPTILSLLGFPVGGDMDGEVALNLVDPRFWRSNPVRQIGTYETGGNEGGVAIDVEMDEETIKELKALGYIN